MFKDQQTGLYRFGVRWYDPSTGRFTQPDPSTLEQHPYLYASANPCNKVDPTGRVTIDSFGCNFAVGLLGADITAAMWAAGELGLMTGGLAGLGIGAAVGHGLTVAGTFICDGL